MVGVFELTWPSLLAVITWYNLMWHILYIFLTCGICFVLVYAKEDFTLCNVSSLLGVCLARTLPIKFKLDFSSDFDNIFEALGIKP